LCLIRLDKNRFSSKRAFLLHESGLFKVHSQRTQFDTLCSTHLLESHDSKIIFFIKKVNISL